MKVSAKLQPKARLEAYVILKRIGENYVLGDVATQREAAAAFEADLERNIAALQQMQRDVRRRAESLDSACNVCVERLSGVAEHAVALRRAQFVHSELDERCVQNV